MHLGINWAQQLGLTLGLDIGFANGPNRVKRKQVKINKNNKIKNKTQNKIRQQIKIKDIYKYKDDKTKCEGKNMIKYDNKTYGTQHNLINTK